MLFSIWQCMRFGCKTKGLYSKIGIFPFPFRSLEPSVYPGQGLFSLAFGHEEIRNIIKPYTFWHNCQNLLQEGSEMKKLKVGPEMHPAERVEGAVTNVSLLCDKRFTATCHVTTPPCQPLILCIKDGPRRYSKEGATFWQFNQPFICRTELKTAQGLPQSFSMKKEICLINMEDINHLWCFIRISSNSCYCNSKVIFPAISPWHSKYVETFSFLQSQKVKWDLLIEFSHRNYHKYLFPGTMTHVHKLKGAEWSLVKRK